MIPFTRTTLGEEEKKAISDVIDSGWVVMGSKTAEFEEKFAEYVGAKYCVFVDSGTSALFLSIKYLCERRIQTFFVVPSLTFTATAEAVINAGASLQFADVSKDTFCMDGEGIGGLPVHLLGNKAKAISIIYDSAHRIEKDDVKDSNALWCYSFYATKNMTTIQGGMIALNDKDAYEWLKMARDHGLDMGTKERYQGKYKQYDVKFIGWREKSDDVHAAVGLEQLKKLPWMTERRNEIVARYNKNLGLHRTGNHVYPVLVNERERFMNYMHDNAIQCTIHFRPLHQMTAYKDYYHGEDMTNTNYIGERICSIPMFPAMTDEEVDYVSEKILASNLLINE